MPLHTYLEDKMMNGCVVGLDDVWQSGNMAHSAEHYGQVSMVAELVASGDWQPLVVPPVPKLPSNASNSKTKAVAEMARVIRHAAAHAHTNTAAMREARPRDHAHAAHKSPHEHEHEHPAPPTFGVEVTRRDVFPENVKQAAVRKVRSRFAQPNEMDTDALRITLVERGGKDVASLWLELPMAPPSGTAPG